MGIKRRLLTQTHARLAAILFVAVLVAPLGQAFAQVQSIEGMDQYYGTEDAAPDTIDVLTVTGSANDTVFIEVSEGKKTIASHLAFTLGDDTARQEGANYLGVVSVSIASYDPSSEYSIAVYEDRAQTKQLYSGTLSAVYAQLEGQPKPRLIAVRTMGDESRSFSVPKTVSFDGANYELMDKGPVAEKPLTYAYQIADEDASVDAYVSYVDDEGNELAREDLGSILAGTSVTATVPSVISGPDGKLYRTLSFSSTVTAANPGIAQHVIRCKPLADTQGYEVEGHEFLACIHLVDGEGNRLADDTVAVNKKYLYTPPARLHLSNPSTGLVDTYTLAGGNDALTASGVLELAPAAEEVPNNQCDYTITYDRLASDAEATWTIVLVNGAADPKASDRVISRTTLAVQPGQTQTYKTEPSIQVGNRTFVPVASARDEYTYTYGAGDDPIVYLYYVPDDYVAPEPYDITVRYVNIANKEVLQSQVLTVRPEDRDELEITSPESFTQGGVEYVRLAGQEKSVFHSYYSSNRTYTIYYRDVNDDLNANVVITHIEVEYVDGPEQVTYVDGGTTYTYVDGGSTTTDGGTTTTYTDGGTTHADGGTTTTYVDGGTTTTDGGTTTTTIDGGTTTTYMDGGTTVRDRGTRVQDSGTTSGYVAGAAIPSNGGLTVINSGDGAVVTDGAGRDTNTMRIEDDETPLAGPAAGVSHGASQAGPWGILPLAVGSALVAGLLLLFFFKRRKKDDEDEDQQQVDEA